ncbi:MAG: carbohydrate-binding protein, partial [Myxococcales bacterium]|nr:carbohydrate-binding protein [Myxococcales bacterium]
GGTGGTGGSAGQGTGGSAGGSGSGTGGSSSAKPSEDDGGCGCRAPARAPSRPLGVALALSALVLFRRRRR